MQPDPKQLGDTELSAVIDHAFEPFFLEKRVFVARMMREHRQQIFGSIDQRASRMADMVEAQKWAKQIKHILNTQGRPVKGYDYCPRDARLVTTANYATGRLYRTSDFTLTVETKHPWTRGVYAVCFVAAIVLLLYMGWQVKKYIDDFGHYFFLKMEASDVWTEYADVFPGRIRDPDSPAETMGDQANE